MNKPLRILLVDDFEMIRSLLKQALKQLGYTDLSEAVDGEDALAKITQAKTDGQNFDIVFLDWNMPKMTGIEVVQKCKGNEELKDIPFIMITAEREQKNVVAALKAGVSDYVIKPFSPKQLGSKIERILNKNNAAS
jgi:two-component system chemotaxis response regulator CheY